MAGEYSERYDWVPEHQLTAEQKEMLGPGCSGMYLDPLADNEAGAGDLEQAPILVDADKSEMAGDAITLEGQVEVSHGQRSLKAGLMAYDKGSDEALLKDDVEFRQKGLLVRGSEAWMNMGGNQARFEGGEFVLHDGHLRGRAGSIEHKADGVVVLKNGMITTCAPDETSWKLEGAEITVDPNKHQGTGKNITISVGKLPVLYAPYITFPVGTDRQTGLLFPSFGRTDGGLDVSIPWYWNIAPNYDATIVPRLAGGHGAMLEAEFRHLSHYAHNAISFGYLPNDEGGSDPDTDALIERGADASQLRPHSGEDRWLINVNHDSRDKSRWYSSIAYAQASDIDYLRDISFDSFDLQAGTHLNQSATLGYRLSNWDVNVNVQDYQNLLADLPSSYRLLPRVNALGKYRKESWGLTLENEYSRFDNSEEGYVTGERFNIDYAIDWAKIYSWGFIRPKAGVAGLAYQLDDELLRPNTDTSPALVSSYASIDTGLFFERENGKHVLEPRLFYLYRQYRDHSKLYNVADVSRSVENDINFDTTPLTFSYHQLFRGRRFAGGDRLGDANQLSVGLTAKWMDDNRANPLASASIGQVFYFQDREVILNSDYQTQTLEESDWAAQLFAAFRENLHFQSDLLYNPETEKVMRGTAGLLYGDLKKRFLKLSYRFVREDPLAITSVPVDQLDTVFTFPVSRQWQIVGRSFYDLKESKELDTFIGFEYDDCCYRVRFLARRWLDSKLAALVEDQKNYYDQGIFLEIDLKGLASSGERIQQLLAEHLPLFNR